MGTNPSPPPAVAAAAPRIISVPSAIESHSTSLAVALSCATKDLTLDRFVQTFDL